ncbi:hypothetical protein GPJ56_002851 [Histomonas meleagridis]|uniref:uncharacterized protein n=1 Tax=Histomonas meleagridis TaxID=135588 RepID=UPI00355983A5|nr:hypothetical protein GPJ56_002851 [Histomonas meleagridis]KAH0806368.1 hypothetical protein GO595_001056 [Histomonas meleagridis]
MDAAIQIAQLLYNMTLPDNEILKQANSQIEMLKNKSPFEFVQVLFLILQNSTKFPPQSVMMSLILARVSFLDATKIKKLNDPTKSYLLIPPEFANEFGNFVNMLLSNQDPNVIQHASNLFGQIAIYLLQFNPMDPIVSLICQNIASAQNKLAYCKALLYVVQDFELESQYQVHVFNIVQSVLLSNNSDDNIKSILLQILSQLVSILSTVLLNQEQCRQYVTAIYSLSASEALKSSVYDYFGSITLEAPELLGYILEIFVQSIKDLVSTQDEFVMYNIFYMWEKLADYSYTEGLFQNELANLLPQIMPIFLKFAESIPNPTELDSYEEQCAPHIDSRNCIQSFIFPFHEILIPILFQYVNANISSTEPQKREVSLFCLSTSYIIKENRNLFSFVDQCLIFIRNGFQDTIRIVKESLELLKNIISYAPDEKDYSPFIPVLMQLINTPLKPTVLDVFESYLEIEQLGGNIPIIFQTLLAQQDAASIDCARKFLQKVSTAEFVQSFIARTIALIEVSVTENDDASYTSSLIDLLLDMINIMKENIVPYFQGIFNLIDQIYKRFEIPSASALRVISCISSIIGDPKFMQYSIEQVMIHMTDENEFMIAAVLSSITNYLSKCKTTENYLHEIMRLLFEMIDKDFNIDTKTSVLEAINALHSSFPTKFIPFFAKLMNVYKGALENISIINDNDKKDETHLAVDLISAILESLSMYLISAIQLNAQDAVQECIQLSLASIQMASGLSAMNAICVLDIFTLLNQLLDIDQNAVKGFILQCNSLKELLAEARGSANQEILQGLENLVKRVPELYNVIMSE